MDREFIIKNQIVERYLAGRLPPKGVTDFERLIRSRPELIEELGLADRVNAGLRLLDAAGIAEPWAEKQKKFWEKPAFTFGAAGSAVAALIACAVLAMQVSSRDAADRQAQAGESRAPGRAVDAQAHHPGGHVAQRSARRRPSLTINAGEFAELKVDLSWTKYAHVPGVHRPRRPGTRRGDRRPRPRIRMATYASRSMRERLALATTWSSSKA